VAGNAREATLTGKSYLQGGKGTPRPVMLTRHVGRRPLAESAAQVLALSKMDWNTDGLYSSLPATLTYAQLLARIVKNEILPPLPYDYRLFM
jgi:argonaute-like protein implicated in RNA metabolism and viral defense